MTTQLARRAFTLIELLVVIAILAALAALLMPAVQAAREAARRSACANHVNQLAKAFLMHEEAQKHYPTGGWGYNWIGEADLGFHNKQPGGWVFNILPYIDQVNVRAMAAGVEKDRLDQKLTALPDGNKQHVQMQMMQTAIVVLICPSRRDATPTPCKEGGWDIKNWDSAWGLGQSKPVAKSDYAACAGDMKTPDAAKDANQVTLKISGVRTPSGGPADFASAPAFARQAPGAAFTGISYQFSQISSAHVHDGTSNTYMLGEKYLNPRSYGGSTYTSAPSPGYTGNELRDYGDNETAYGGYNYDLFRSTYLDPTDPTKNYAPQQDTEGVALISNFGSAHVGTFNMALCDGSVRQISYEIDPAIHRLLGVRNDGQPLDTSKF